MIPPPVASLLWMLAAVLIAGVLVWALDALPGIDPAFKQVARVIIIAVLMIYVILLLFGWLAGAPLRLWR